MTSLESHNGEDEVCRVYFYNCVLLYLLPLLLTKFWLSA